MSFNSKGPIIPFSLMENQGMKRKKCRAKGTDYTAGQPRALSGGNLMRSDRTRSEIKSRRQEECLTDI